MLEVASMPQQKLLSRKQNFQKVDVKSRMMETTEDAKVRDMSVAINCKILFAAPCSHKQANQDPGFLCQVQMLDLEI